MDTQKGFSKSVISNLTWIACAIMTACVLIYMEKTGRAGMGGALVGGLAAALTRNIWGAKNNEWKVSKFLDSRTLLLISLISLIVIIFVNYKQMNVYLSTGLTAAFGFLLGQVISDFIYRYKNKN